jgi:hypothetical protein
MRADYAAGSWSCCKVNYILQRSEIDDAILVSLECLRSSGVVVLVVEYKINKDTPLRLSILALDHVLIFIVHIS